MNAFLLAAGMGSRLKPLTLTVPKCLVEIDGRPLLEYWLKMLRHPLIDSVYINMHYMHNKVEEYLSEQHIVPTNAIFEPELLGTAGTLKKNCDKLRGKPLIVIHADNLSLFSMSKFIERHNQRSEGCVVTMMTFKTDNPSQCGVIELNELGLVSQFHEKVDNPPSNIANGAVYIFEPEIIDFISRIPKDTIDISLDIIPRYLGRIQTFYNDTYHRDIGTPQSYALAQKEFSSVKMI